MTKVAGVKRLLRGLVYLDGLLACRVAAERALLPANRDLRIEAVTNLPDALYPKDRICTRLSPVMLIQVLRNVSQVSNSIVEFVSVDVVKLLSWPLTKDVKPSESVSRVLSSKNPEPYVTPFVESSWNIANVAPVGASDASEFSRLYVVMKGRAKTFAGKIRSSHEAPVKQIGQRPASVSALSGLCYGSAS